MLEIYLNYLLAGLLHLDDPFWSELQSTTVRRFKNNFNIKWFNSNIMFYKLFDNLASFLWVWIQSVQIIQRFLVWCGTPFLGRKVTDYSKLFHLAAEVPEVYEEEEESRSVVKVDRRNPWGQVAEEWAGTTSRRPREYQIELEELDRPPRL